MKKLFLILIPLFFLGCCGMLVIAPMLLLSLYVSSLPGLPETFQEQLNFFSNLAIVEDGGEGNGYDSALHSITLTLGEEDLNNLLYETVSTNPSRVITISDVQTDISAEGIRIILDVHYRILGVSFFRTSILSEWRLRISPAFSASPLPCVVELKPTNIRAEYLRSFDWISFWNTIQRNQTPDGWTRLRSTSWLHLEDVSIQDHEIAFTVAPQ